ncbi:MAG: cupredoxin domain-containing protein [Actinobacteria bacterium]|nr:cupredoxin domain-containing protein [Actinomycetota bacterium]
MNKNTRDRLLLPILMPVGILGVILLVTVGFSRILLSLNAEAATTLALLAAGVVMGVAAVGATRRQMKGSSVFAAVAAIAGAVLFFGGVILALAGGPGEEAAVGGPAVEVNITAKNSLFVETNITVPVETALAVNLDNQDASVQHNVEVFDGPDANAPVIIDGEVITGPAKITYEVPPLVEGDYYFICKIHPTTMTGNIKADPAATAVSYSSEPVASPSAGPTDQPTAEPTTEPTGKPTVLKLVAPVGAVGTGYDQTSLEAKAGSAITIEFDNQDSGVPHDADVMSADPASDPAATKLFDGDVITGPATASYDVGPLDKGTYFFLCSVHPTTMNGILTVK